MQKNLTLRFITIIQLVIFTVFTIPSFAAQPTWELDTGKAIRGEAEYSNSNKDKRMNIRITLLSGVRNPGIHYIPDNTSLLELFSLAGGVSAEAETDKIMIKRVFKDEVQNLKYDLTELLNSKEVTQPMLMHNDVIMIPEVTENFRKDLLLNLTIFASLLGIITSSLAVHTALSK